jgi:hypothetical protein
MLDTRPQTPPAITKYSAKQIEHLLTGCEFFDGFGRPRSGRADDAAWREAWDDLRDKLLTKFIDDYPGHRPWAWWRFDCPAPGRRRRIGGKPHPFDNEHRKAHIERLARQRPTADDLSGQLYELWFGKPASLIGLDDIQADYESERQFLERHGLLTDAERAALRLPPTGLRLGRALFRRAAGVAARLAMFTAGTYFYGFSSRHAQGNDLPLLTLGAGLLVASLVPWGSMFARNSLPSCETSWH